METHLNLKLCNMGLASWHKHSQLLQELGEDGADADAIDIEELPRPVDGALLAVLEKLADHADRVPDPLAWRAICHVVRTKCLRPQLFEGVTDTQLDALEETLDYYGLPKAWNAWVAQERAARHVDLQTMSALMTAMKAVPPPPIEETGPLAPLLSDAMERIMNLSHIHYIHDFNAVTMALLRLMPLTHADAEELHFDEALLAVLVGYPLDCVALRYRRSDSFYSILAACGDVRGLSQMHEMRDTYGDLPIAWYSFVCDRAAEGGHLDCLKFAHEHGYSWDEQTCAMAAKAGSLDCLMYAHKHGCAWNGDTTVWAARNGHLDCLMYAHKHGCSFNSRVTAVAARGGHLDCLTFAYEHVCPWSVDTCTEAATERTSPLLAVRA